MTLDDDPRVWWCSTCRAPQPLARPDCADDHGPDCPEWFCVGCASAVVSHGVLVPAA